MNRSQKKTKKKKKKKKEGGWALETDLINLIVIVGRSITRITLHRTAPHIRSCYKEYVKPRRPRKR
jgi:hypothetical protein